MSPYESQLRRLEDLKHQLEADLAPVDGDRLNRRPSAGGWSPGQVLAHIIEAEGKSLAYVRKKVRDGEGIPRRGLRQRLNGLVLAAAMKSPFKFEAPPAVGEPPDRVEFAALTEDWERVREGWADFVASFPPELADRTVYRHPVAGPMTLADALRFLITHLERHGRQIRRRLS